MSIYWLLAFFLLLLVEIATVNLVSIWFAIGAVAAFVSCFFTDNVFIQLLVFVIVSTITLVCMLPLVKKFKKNKKVIPTNVDRVLGKSGIVTQKITVDHYGEVKVLESVWTAVSGETIEVGEKVKVDKIDGVKLIVTKEEKK